MFTSSAIHRKSAKLDRTRLIDRELRYEGGLARSIDLFDITDGLDLMAEALSWYVEVFLFGLLYAEIFFLEMSTLKLFSLEICSLRSLCHGISCLEMPCPKICRHKMSPCYMYRRRVLVLHPTPGRTLGQRASARNAKGDNCNSRLKARRCARLNEREDWESISHNASADTWAFR